MSYVAISLIPKMAAGGRALAGRAPGIFFDPCPTGDLLGGALQLFGRLAVLEPHTL